LTAPNSQNKKISIVTATFNAADYLPSLIESLRNQMDKDFRWIVADGASTDGTLDVLNAIKDIDLLILSQPDFGIYDALNRAIKTVDGEYYIVCGADDIFDEDAIANYRSAIELSHADIVTAHAMYENNILKPKNCAPWLWGHRAYIAAHTLATAYKKTLHQRFGYYSSKYPIAADQFFVMQACKSGIKLHEAAFIAGRIGNTGVSSVDRPGNATEVFRVQLALGSSKWLQTLVLFLRLLNI
jgi:glycosyltransferase involved in cell wall biosynthesis